MIQQQKWIILMCILLRSLTLAILTFVYSLPLLAATEWVDFELDNGLISLPVEINGIHGKAILDTGAGINAINQSFIDRYRLDFKKGGEAIVTGINSEEVRDYYDDVKTTLFGVVIEIDQLTSMRLGHHSNMLLLGGGFLKNFIVQIDYPNQRLRLFQRDSIDLYNLKNIRMVTDRKTKHPVVKVDLNGHENIWLIMDTGNSGGIILKRSIAVNEGWLEKYDTESILVQGVLEVSHQESFILPEVTFGPFIIENVAISVPAEGQNESFSTTYGFGKSIKGILGYDVLKHFVLTIDYTTGYMHVGLPED